MLNRISFQVLRAEYENPFFAYSRSGVSNLQPAGHLWPVDQ